LAVQGLDRSLTNLAVLKMKKAVGQRRKIDVCLFATTTNKLVLHNTDVIWAGRVVFILEAQEIVGRDTRFWFKSMTISCRDLYACVCFLLLCILFAVVSRCEP